MPRAPARWSARWRRCSRAMPDRAARAATARGGCGRAASALAATRPTAVNLAWALSEMRRVLAGLPPERRLAAALDRAGAIAEEDVAINRSIGEHGLPLIEAARQAKAGHAP